MKSTLLIILMLSIFTQLNSATISPNASGNYNTIANWDPNDEPTPGDNVEITSTCNYITTYTLTEDEQFDELSSAINTGDGETRSLTFISDDPGTIRTLTLSSISFGSATEPVELIIDAGVHLVVTGTTSLTSSIITVKSGGSVTFNTLALIRDGGATNPSLDIQEGAVVTVTTMTSSSGTCDVTVDGNLDITTLSPGHQLNLEINDGGVVNVTNNINYNNSILTINSGGAFNTDGDIVFGGSFTGTIDGTLDVSGDLDINWGLSITGNGSVTAGSFSNGGTIFGLQALDMEDGATYNNTPLGPSATYYSSTIAGDWDDTGSWSVVECGGTTHPTSTPGDNDKIIICDGHTIKIPNNQNNTQIYDVTINTGGILDANGKPLTINGSFKVDGTFYIGGNEILQFTGGDGTSISGTGIISLKHANSDGEDMDINGSTEISSGSSLYIYGSMVITSNDTITNYGIVETTKNIEGDNANSVWINSTDSYLKVSGTMLSTGILDATNADNTVEYAMNGDVTLAPYTYIYHNLVISGTGTKDQDADLTINGDFTVNSGIYDPAGNNLTVKGDWIFSNESFNETKNDTVIFSGTANQSITNPVGETFNNLKIDKSAGTITLIDDVNVKDTLILKQGNINTGDNILSLGTTSKEGTLVEPVGSTIIGKYKTFIDINNTSTDYLLPVGTADNYRPATISFDNMSATGTYGGLITEFVAETPGPLDPRPTVDTSTNTDIYNTFSEGYWTIAVSDGLSSTSFDLKLVGTNFDSFTAGESTRLFARANSSSAWMSDGTHDPIIGATASRLDMKTLPGEYSFADPTACDPPILSNLVGDQNVCIEDTVTYTITSNETGNTFYWEVIPAEAGTPIPATQVDVGFTSSIDIAWANTGYNAIVRVTAENTCTFSQPIDSSVTSEPIAPTFIFGSKSVPEDKDAVGYYVTDLGYTYTWTITGGDHDPNPAFGQGTDTISVDWGSAGTGNVSVVTSNIGCGSTPAVDLDVDKYIVIKSIATGNWSDNSTWDCGCEPSITDNVQITGGHTVTLSKAGTQVKNLVIDGGNTLTSSNQDILINGDLLVNGEITFGSNADITMSGAGALIDGAGSITADILCNGGSKTVSYTAFLDLTGNLTIDAGAISVTNNGHININGNIVGTASTISWANAAYSHLGITGELLTQGDLEASSNGNTVEYNGSAAQTIKEAKNNDYFNLEITGSNTCSLESDLDINGSVIIGSGATLDVTASNYDLTVAGDWSNSGTFIERNGTISFDGTNGQTLTNTTDGSFFEIDINKASGLVTLANNLTISDTLSMIQGDINTDTYNLTLGTAAEGKLYYSSGKIYATNGNFVRYLSTTGNKLFPIGTSSTYLPMTIGINTIGTAGTLSASFTVGDPGGQTNPPFPISDVTTNADTLFTDGSWTFDASTISISDYDLSLTATNFSSYTINSTTRLLKRTNGGNWFVSGTHKLANNPDVYRLNIVSGLSDGNSYDYGLGDTDCDPLDNPTITGTTDVCSSTTETYSIPDNGNNYQWFVSSHGSITAGGTTNEVTIDWGANPTLEAYVRVVEYTSCFYTDTVTLDINVHSLETAPISGPAEVPENLTIGAYSVSELRSGYQYIWSVTGGTPSEDTATSINVTWGGQGAGTITVKGEYIGCSAAADEILNVTIVAMNETTGTGAPDPTDWTNPDNWTLGVPGTGGANDYARIKHNMDCAPTDQTIEYLVIDNGLTLSNSSNSNLTINAGYINNGIHNASDGDVDLNGTSSMIIDGSGTTNFGAGEILISNNVSNQILSTADLTINGNITIANGNILRNNGTLTINGTIDGGGASATFYNYTDAGLSITGALMSTGDFDGSSSGNTVNYSGTGAQTIKDGASNKYYNLTCSGSNTKTLENTVDIDGNLLISGSASLDVSASNYNINLVGNWINTSSGEFIQQNGRVSFVGATDQAITNTNGETFYDLYIIKTGGGALNLSAGTSIYIEDLASFQKGIINTTSPDAVVFNHGSSVSGSAGDADCYVDGLVSKIGNDAFVFPTGDGTIWARIGIGAPAATNSKFTAEYNWGSHSDLDVSGLLTKVSSKEFWNLNQDVANADNIAITLYWEDSTRSRVGNSGALVDLRVAHYDGSVDWDEVGYASHFFTDAGTYPGYITSVPTSTFSPFTFGSVGSENPLPIELLNFTAKSLSNQVDLSWSTATETNNDYFTIERSANGINFEALLTKPGAGNSSSELGYKVTDFYPLNGTSYYRLKQTDFDGKYSYSKVVSINRNENMGSLTNHLNIYPNPFSEGDFVIETANIEVGEQIEVYLFDIHGHLLHTVGAQNPGNQKITLMSDVMNPLPAGIYIVRVNSANANYHARLVIQ